MGMNFDYFDKIIRYDYFGFNVIYLGDLLFCCFYK